MVITFNLVSVGSIPRSEQDFIILSEFHTRHSFSKEMEKVRAIRFSDVCGANISGHFVADKRS